MTSLLSRPAASLRHIRSCFVAVSAVVLVTACAEVEPILPGQREDIRSVLQTVPVEPETVPANTSAPIQLPAQVSNANWTQAPGTPSVRVAHAALRPNPQVVWSASIGAGDSRKQRITANPVVSNGLIYTLDAGSLVTATATNGGTVWSTDIRPVRDGEGEATGGGLAAEGGTLYVSIGYGSLVALDAATGAIKWRQQLDATGSGTPTVFGDLVYVTGGDDTGWAVNKQTGRIEWQTGAATDVNNVLGAPAPAISGDLAVFGFGSGEVRAVFRRGGLRRWDASVAGQRSGRALGVVTDVTASPVISGQRVYVGSQSGRLAAFDLASGDRIWAAKEGAVAPVLPVGNSVFVISDLNELLRLDASSGARIWGVTLPKFTSTRPRRQSQIYPHHGPILAGGRIIVASGDGVLRSYNPVDGTLVGTSALPDGATTAPVVAGNTLYVVSAGGQLHALR